MRLLCLTLAFLITALESNARAQHLTKSSDTILDPRALAFTDGQWGTCINGQSFQEDYLASGTQTLTEQQAPNSFVLGENSYFMMGDNRQYSEDSRFYGAISRASIVGMLAK